MTTSPTHNEHRTVARPAPGHEELSVAQRAAVHADARLVVVQGGPGSGKTETALARLARLTTGLRQDAAWLLALVTSEAKVAPFRLRLGRALQAAGCGEALIQRTTACVLSATALAGEGCDGDAGGPLPLSAWPPETMRCVSEAAHQLAPSLGLTRRTEEARDLLLETMRLVSRGCAAESAGDGDWLRRGVALVEAAVRFAQVETLRHLRMLEGTPGWVGDLGRQLRRAGDVAHHSRDLRAAVERALRTATDGRADLERLRGWVDVAGIDLAEAARREAVAATARRRLWETAQELVEALGVPSPRDAGSVGGSDAALMAGARHVVVDDAHDLSAAAMARVRSLLSPASLFVTGDQRAALRSAGGDAQFRSLLKEAGRAVVLLEAPRFGAGIGRFINALGSRLWPASEPGGYAPAIARMESDPAATAPVELWLVRRRAEARGDGRDHPEPIECARLREARAVAAGVRWMHRVGDGSAAVLVQDAEARGPVLAALEAEGAAGHVDVRTVDECRGLEWPTVFVAGLDEPLGGPAPRRAWVDPESGLAVVWPEDDSGRRIWPFSSLLLAQRAAAMRDAEGRRRLFLAAARARTRLVLTGVTREQVAGGESCVAPIEWLRRQVGVSELSFAPRTCRMGESQIGVRLVDDGPFLPT